MIKNRSILELGFRCEPGALDILFTLTEILWENYFPKQEKSNETFLRNEYIELLQKSEFLLQKKVLYREKFLSQGIRLPGFFWRIPTWRCILGEDLAGPCI